MDTGSQLNLLKPSAVIDRRLHIEKINPPRPIRGVSGATFYADDLAYLGDHKMVVAEGIHDNIFSTSPDALRELNAILQLTPNGGSLSSLNSTKSIPINNDNNTWRASLDDIESFRKPHTQVLSVINSQDSEIMCYYGQLATLENTNLPIITNPPRVYRLPFPVDGTKPSYLRPVNTKIQLRTPSKYSKLQGSDVLARYIDIHERSGHASTKNMCRAINSGTWLNVGLTDGQVRRASKQYKCPHCILAKSNALSVPINEILPSDEFQDVGFNNSKFCSPGEIISIDPVGPITPLASTSKYKYFYLAKDVATGFDHVFCSATDTSEVFITICDHLINWYASHGLKVCKIRTDASRVNLSNAVTTFLADRHIVPQNSIPYKQWQNAVERDIQTIVKGASLLLHSQPWLRADSWHYALFHFIDARNRTPNNKDVHSPYEIITKQILDFSTTLRFAFGDVIAYNIPADQRNWKFDLHNDIGIYVGHAVDTKHGCLIYSPRDKSVKVRYDCRKIEITDKQFMHYYLERILKIEEPLAYSEIENAFHDFLKPIVSDSTNQPSSDSKLPLYDPDFLPHIPLLPPRQPSNRRSPPPTTRRLRSQDSMDVMNITCKSEPIISEPITTDTSDPADSFMAEYFCYAAKVPEINLQQALSSKDAEGWIKVIKEEVHQLIHVMKTLIPYEDADVPPDHLLIKTTMVLKAKYHQDNTLNKLKARICGRGDMLAGYVDSVFAPTVSALTFATVLQLSIIDKMHACTFDTVGAYLHQDYPQDTTPLFVTLPKEVAQVCGLNPDARYRINKYIYGLPDSGRAYYKAYSEHLMKSGYKRTVADPCLFVRIHGDIRTYVWCHVDDTFICTTHKEELLLFNQLMSTKFSVTYEENVTEYLGIKFKYQLDGSVILSQPKLLTSIFDTYLTNDFSITTRQLSAQRQPVKDDPTLNIYPCL